MPPTSRACSPRSILRAAALLLLASCASPSLPEAAVQRRSPDGVAIDPMSAPPAPRDRAEVSDGLVTLRTPLGVDRAIAVVDELFKKIVVEDGEGLDPLFTRDAIAITSHGGQTPQALHFWQGRFRKLDYTKLAGEILYREGDITIYRADDAIAAPPHPAVRADLLGGGDVVIRVPILTPRVGADRLFGDEIIVWLRRDGDRYRIFRLLEDFQIN